MIATMIIVAKLYTNYGVGIILDERREGYHSMAAGWGDMGCSQLRTVMANL